MKNLTKDEAFRKKAIFDSMSPRRKKHIQKIGYDKWNPFQEPKDPIDIRRDNTKRTSKQLLRDFLGSRNFETISTKYSQGVAEICLGIINEDDRFRGMYEFSIWYRDLLEKEGKEFQS